MIKDPTLTMWYTIRLHIAIYDERWKFQEVSRKNKISYKQNIIFTHQFADGLDCMIVTPPLTGAIMLTLVNALGVDIHVGLYL